MRSEDLKRMNKEYFRLKPLERVNVPPKVWGFEVEPANSLGNLIFDDIDETSLGVAWWAQHSSIGQKARIMISDYLHQSSFGLNWNLIEAKLHLLEAKHLNDKNQKHTEDLLVLLPDNSFDMRHQPLPSMQEHIDSQMEEMHTAGFFRAIGTTLDLLAALIIGVVALPCSLFKAKFSDIPQSMDQEGRGNKLRGDHPIQREFLDAYYVIISNDGWLRWTNEYRNMLTHRSRLAQMHSLHPRTIKNAAGQPLLDAKGRPIIKTLTVTHLPSEPDLSEVEVMRNNFEGLLLKESSLVTMEGVFDRTVEIVNRVCLELQTTWTKRKNDPLSLQQPSNQWSNTNRTSFLSFAGIAPNSVPVNARRLSSDYSRIKRLKAASLDSQNQHKWQTMT